MAAPPVGARIGQDLVLDAAAIKNGASLVGDLNPLHHDETIAAQSRYGGLIASGAHTSAILAALTTRGFGNEAEDGYGGVGVDYRVRFRRPVRGGRPLRMEWIVLSVEPHRSGSLARLEGRILDQVENAVALEAEMTILYFGPARTPNNP